MNRGALAGIRVVELSGIGPGPCAGMMFADMGAEVILVERKTVNSNAAAILPQEEDVKQAFFNRGKKSIAVDLKNPEGVELVLELVTKSDLLIEGFRPGVMERLGLGPDVCLQRNPKLVYGRITGWGQTGPMADAAGHDPNFIALSGALWYGGRKNRVPTAPLTLVGDMGGGTMMLAWGVLCALMHARNTGEGQVVDSAITDGSAYLSSLLWMMRNMGQISDQPESGWADGAAPWNDTYECADGKFITLCAVEPAFYRELLELLGLCDNPLFADQWERSSWPQGKVELKKLFLSKTREQWCDLIEGSDACFAPVLDFSEAPQHPHNIARHTFVEIDGVTQPAPAPKLSRSQASAGVPPGIGEHTDEVLAIVGLDRAVIAELKAKGVV